MPAAVVAVTRLEAVVMAAGDGRRMRPLTDRWPKPVLPIDGRPVIATLVRELASAGLERVTVVVGHLARQVETLLGDGSAFGLEIRYAHQHEPLGSADAVRCALAAGARPPLLVSAADTVFASGDVHAAASRWLASGTRGALGVRDVPLEEIPEKSSVRVEAGRVRAVVVKPPPGPRESTRAAAPLWYLDAAVAGRRPSLPGPPYELAALDERAIDAGETILALPLGPTRDITHPEDVIARNFPYLSTE